MGRLKARLEHLGFAADAHYLQKYACGYCSTNPNLAATKPVAHNQNICGFSSSWWMTASLWATQVPNCNAVKKINSAHGTAKIPNSSIVLTVFQTV